MSFHLCLPQFLSCSHDTITCAICAGFIKAQPPQPNLKLLKQLPLVQPFALRPRAVGNGDIGHCTKALPPPLTVVKKPHLKSVLGNSRKHFCYGMFRTYTKAERIRGCSLASTLSPPGQWPSFLCPPVTRPHCRFEAKPQHRPFSLHLCKVTRTLHLHPGLRAKAGQWDRRDPRLFLGDTE